MIGTHRYKEWQNKPLLDIYEQVELSSNKKDELAILQLGDSAYSQIKKLIENACFILIEKVDSGEYSLLTVFNHAFNGKPLRKIDKKIEQNFLQSLPLSHQKEIGTVPRFQAEMIVWGYKDMKSFFSHYGTKGYSVKTAKKATEIHRQLMISGYESNYLQMVGFISIRDIEKQVAEQFGQPFQDQLTEDEIKLYMKGLRCKD